MITYVPVSNREPMQLLHITYPLDYDTIDHDDFDNLPRE